jgi:hypothetical protein
MTFLHMAKDGVTSAKSPIESLAPVKKPPLEELLRNPKPAEAKPILRVFAG